MSLGGADLEKTSILFELAEPIPGPSANAITKAAKENNIYVIVGMPEANTEFLGQIHNSALFTGPKGIIVVYRKIHLVNLPSFPTVRETHWGFSPGTEISVWKIKQGWKIGVNICYDQGMTEIPRIQAIKGADVIVCISAGPTELKDAWYMYNQVRAMENTVFIVYSNFVGKQWGGVSFFGGAMVIKPTGEFVAKGPVDEEAMTMA